MIFESNMKVYVHFLSKKNHLVLGDLLGKAHVCFWSLTLISSNFCFHFKFTEFSAGLYFSGSFLVNWYEWFMIFKPITSDACLSIKRQNFKFFNDISFCWKIRKWQVEHFVNTVDCLDETVRWSDSVTFYTQITHCKRGRECHAIITLLVACAFDI